MPPSEAVQSLIPGWTVTISRQMGSLGMPVAQASADLLGYRLVRQELIQTAAQQIGKPEMLLAFIDDLGLLDICPDAATCRAFRKAIADLMHRYAAEGGAVIVGRAGQVILKDHPRALHVRVIAPKNLRVERVAREQGINVSAALAQIEASDRSRQTYLRRFYEVRWDNPSLYHLVLNTAYFTPEQAAHLVQAALLEFSRTATLPTASRSYT